MTQVLNSPNHLGLISLDGIVAAQAVSGLESRMPPVKNVGKPCAGEPHARFDGRGLETEAIPATVEAKAAAGKPRQERQTYSRTTRHRASPRPS